LFASTTTTMSEKSDRSPPRSPRSPDRREDSRERERRDRHEDPNGGDTLYVSGLHPKTTEAELEARFSKYGKVVSCKLITDPRSHESRGFAFIKYEHPDDAREAIFHLDRTDLDGRQITVEKARRGREYDPTPGQYLGKAKAPRHGGYGGGGGYAG